MTVFRVQPTQPTQPTRPAQQPPFAPSAAPSPAERRTVPQRSRARDADTTTLDPALTPEEERLYRRYLQHYARGTHRALPVVTTRLGAALLGWIDAERLLQHEAAERLGVGKKILWRYLTSGLRPNPLTLERMHHVTGIGRDALLQLAVQVPGQGRSHNKPDAAASSVAAMGAAPSARRVARPRPVPPPPTTDAWDAFTTRIASILPAGAERRAVLAEIEALRAGAISPAQRVIAPSPAPASAQEHAQEHAWASHTEAAPL